MTLIVCKCESFASAITSFWAIGLQFLNMTLMEHNHALFYKILAVESNLNMVIGKAWIVCVFKCVFHTNISLSICILEEMSEICNWAPFSSCSKLELAVCSIPEREAAFELVGLGPPNNLTSTYRTCALFYLAPPQKNIWIYNTKCPPAAWTSPGGCWKAPSC